MSETGTVNASVSFKLVDQVLNVPRKRTARPHAVGVSTISLNKQPLVLIVLTIMQIDRYFIMELIGNVCLTAMCHRQQINSSIDLSCVRYMPI